MEVAINRSNNLICRSWLTKCVIRRVREVQINISRLNMSREDDIG